MGGDFPQLGEGGGTFSPIFIWKESTAHVPTPKHKNRISPCISSMLFHTFDFLNDLVHVLMHYLEGREADSLAAISNKAVVKFCIFMRFKMK